MNLDFVTIPAGEFLMGSDRHYPEEAPPVRVTVSEFAVTRAPITNVEFAEFVATTDYVTVAERLTANGTPAGSLVFVPSAGPIPLADWRAWWAWVPGATWRHPYGPDADVSALLDHPVVHIALADARAFCDWAGARLPTEEEWERAARGGLEGAEYAWGDAPNAPSGLMANTWQGEFPWRNTGARGWVGTSPVGTFPANGYGLVDVCGNVWEWTDTEWSPSPHQPVRPSLLGAASEPTDDGKCCGCGCGQTGETSSPFVIKGGSHLCADSYCFRYRPAARSAHDPDSATTHLGFRVVKRQ